MKILYVNSLYSPLIEGGAEISLKLIVEGIKSLGHEVVVLSLSPNTGLAEEMVDGVKVYRAGLENRYWPYSSGKANKLSRIAWHLKDRSNSRMGTIVRQVLEKEKPDVVSCHNLAGWSIKVWDEITDFGVPIVQVLHDLYLLCPNSNMFKGNTPCDNQCFSCKLMRLTHREKSQQVSAVVGISKSILGRFEAVGYFAKAQKYVIMNTRAVPNPPTAKSRTAGQPLKIGYLGTLSSIKGVEWLIEQFKKLPFPASLLLGGKGNSAYETLLKNSSKGFDITFLGYVESQKFFSGIDVLVVPSLWQEPLGMVAIESLANHVPVIANKTGGLQETVKDSINGLYCYDNEPDSLAEALTRLFENTRLYNELSKNARSSVAPILSAERMLNEYSSVLYKVVKT